VSASITDTTGIIAIAAAAVALLALVVCVTLLISLRRVRVAQRAVLGEREPRDLIAHAHELQGAFDSLREYVEQIALRLDGRLAQAESDLQGAIAHTALVRYDAYNELSGRQSMSIALLDSDRSGIVLSCIHHRDQARVYGKLVRDGQSELEFSPEEAEAVRLALSPSSVDDPDQPS
jgi:uncharacterized protein DUF4446